MSDVFRVLLTDLPWGDSEIERSGLEPLGVEVIEASDDGEDALVGLADGVDAIATCWARVTDRVIAAAPDCRLIARMGIGLDNIDVTSATKRGVPVTNVPDYCVEEVADHTIALTFAHLRGVGFYHLQTKRGEYDLQAGPEMHRLSTMTLGLIGLGRIGQAVARRAEAFGFTVIAHTPSGESRGTGCRMVDLETLLRESDVISLHAPLTDATKHLIDGAALGEIKRSAYLVNTSRGGLIDHEALEAALASGRIAGAALDVFEPEPPDLDASLFRDDRVIATPHAAFVSVESLVELRTRVAQQIAAVLSGERPENVVNPDVYGD
ncbi:MAG: C-terminal binding protein [Planctomycetota bacterium]|nr:MAG: C-terminal binding protein [Planctomycetota bacterium]REJ95870.1 MAG: C-terminal binding protein [Planctomycetota bacterium]REK25225.1 MAG: C-terminal binding protein [Planctomycetota bacterium]REK34682.1 MAG: C-terminal binding protein [Planctomycetota bacterium]